MKQQEAIQKLGVISEQMTKIGQETQSLLTKVADLQAAAENADNVSPELQAAIEAVSNQANAVDVLVPDNIPSVEQPPEAPVEASTTP